MSNALYVGGYLSSRRSVAGVREALLETGRYSDVIAVRFSDATKDIKSREALAVAAVQKAVYTHSAGALAVRYTLPKELHAFAPPLPDSRGKLMIAAGHKVIQMYRNCETSDDVKRMRQFNNGVTAELFAHPIRNNRPLINGEITGYDAIEDAGLHVLHGADATVIYGSEDLFYRLSSQDRERARTLGVHVVDIAGGVHDDLVLDPKRVLSDYYERF